MHSGLACLVCVQSSFHPVFAGFSHCRASRQWHTTLFVLVDLSAEIAVLFLNFASLLIPAPAIYSLRQGGTVGLSDSEGLVESSGPDAIRAWAVWFTFNRCFTLFLWGFLTAGPGRVS